MKRLQFRPVGFRTIKTALAALIVLSICDAAGRMDYVLALIGVYCAMERTIAESWRGCLTQFFGVLVGSALGFLLLLVVPSPPGWLMALGLVAVISVCNVLKIPYAAFLTSTIFVSICSGSSTATDILLRIRDVSIGLAAGLCVNLFIHPYSASTRVYACIRGLQKEALACVWQAALFGRYADLDACRELLFQMRMERKSIVRKLPLPALQARAARELAPLDGCIQLAERMTQEVEAICSMDTLGTPSEENRTRLVSLGCTGADEAVTAPSGAQEQTVLNYHLDCFLRAYDFLSQLLPPEPPRREKPPFLRRRGKRADEKTAADSEDGRAEA